MIAVKAQSDEMVSVAQQDITELLRERHNIGKNQEDDFQIRNLAEMQESIKSTTNPKVILS